ncbi:unnamed protein product [Phytomonas sp. Hart1]|nr:unnamed protein product [Phytomonas sp. Hart1]|eukprot:CCW68369.1 unnamed protein product [Phytomonas sp. isolate Hart1]
MRLMACGRRISRGLSPLVQSALIAGGSRRGFNLDPRGWISSPEGRSSFDKLEETMPEIFEDQPEAVEDYISPEKTTFERIEDFWDWAVGFMQPVEKQIDLMRGLLHEGLWGFHLFGSWGAVLLFYGAFLRLLTLTASLYSHRNMLRLGQIGPQLSELNSQQSRSRGDRSLSTAEKRIVKDGYKRLKAALMHRHRCSQSRSFLTALTAPLTMSAFIAARRLALDEDDLHGVSFCWVKDLTQPDPTYALPGLCTAIFLGNFEFNQRLQRGGRSPSSLYIRWGMRAGTAVGLYLLIHQPAAMFVYWIGLSTVGILQPILLRWQPFRDFWEFPDPPQAARQNIVARLKGPSLYERWFATKEEKLRRERERRAEYARLSTKKFETINDYEVIFDSPPAESSVKPAFGYTPKK